MTVYGKLFTFKTKSADYDGWHSETVQVHAIVETQAREFLTSTGMFRNLELVSQSK